MVVGGEMEGFASLLGWGSGWGMGRCFYTSVTKIRRGLGGAEIRLKVNRELHLYT